MKRRVSRAIVEMITRQVEPNSSVTIDRLKDGTVTYSVKASGSSVWTAKSRALAAFKELEKELKA